MPPIPAREKLKDSREQMSWQMIPGEEEARGGDRAAETGQAEAGQGDGEESGSGGMQGNEAGEGVLHTLVLNSCSLSADAHQMECTNLALAVWTCRLLRSIVCTQE